MLTNDHEPQTAYDNWIILTMFSLFTLFHKNWISMRNQSHGIFIFKRFARQTYWHSNVFIVSHLEQDMFEKKLELCRFEDLLLTTGEMKCRSTVSIFACHQVKTNQSTWSSIPKRISFIHLSVSSDFLRPPRQSLLNQHKPTNGPLLSEPWPNQFNK